MDPWMLAYLAGHRDMSITKRYVHSHEYNMRAAIGEGTGGIEAQSDSEYHAQIANRAVMASVPQGGPEYRSHARSCQFPQS